MEAQALAAAGLYFKTPSHILLIKPSYNQIPIKTPNNNVKSRPPFISSVLSKSTVDTSTLSRPTTLPTPAVASPPPTQMVTTVEEIEIPLKRVSADSLQYPSGFLGAVPDRTCVGGDDDGEGVVSAMEYLTSILSPKVYDVAVESPLQLATKLSERLGVKVWLKREDLQPVSVFYCIHYGFTVH